MTDIRTAYCFETDAIEPADLAVQKRDVRKQEHHYFCLSSGCAFPLVPAHWHETGVAWYRSEPITSTHNHVISCQHRLLSGMGASTARHEITYRVDNSQRVLVPTILDKIELEQVRAWPNAAPPTRAQIAALAAKAKQFQLSGDIEDIVDAYEKIRGERSGYPLEVNGRKGDYRTAFPWIWDLPQPWNREEWDQHIVRSYCKVSSGTMRSGIWFLNIWPPKNPLPQQEVRIGITIRKEDFAKDTKKKALLTLLDQAVAERKNVQLFWHGPPPTIGDKGAALGVPRPNYASFAIRRPPNSSGPIS